MLTISDKSTHLATPSLSLGTTLSLTILGLVVGITTLVQSFHVIPYPNLFIRWCELLFTGVFLFQARRSNDFPAITSSVIRWSFIAWLVLSTISVIQAVQVGPAVIRQAEWLTHILFAVALWGFLQRQPLSYKVIFLFIPLGFLLFALYMFQTWMTMPNPRTFDWFAGAPLIGWARILGYYALAALLSSAYPLISDAFSKYAWPTRVAVLISMCVCWGFLFWTGGRAAIGCGLMGLAVITWYARKDQRAWIVGITVVAIVVGLFLSNVFWTTDTKMGVFNAVERTVEYTSTHGTNGFVTGRFTIWEVALRNTADHIWFGLGPDGYRFIEEPHHGIQPHGSFVLFLVEWGILGSIPFVILLFFAFKTAFVRLRAEHDPTRKTARIIAFALILGISVHSLVSGLFYHAQPLMFLFIGFAITLLPLHRPHTSPTRTFFFRGINPRYVLWGFLSLLALIFFLNSNTIYKLFY